MDPCNCNLAVSQSTWLSKNESFPPLFYSFEACGSGGGSFGDATCSQYGMEECKALPQEAGCRWYEGSPELF